MIDGGTSLRTVGEPARPTGPAGPQGPAPVRRGRLLPVTRSVAAEAAHREGFAWVVAAWEEREAR
ncbi:hypothetical protein DN051_12945 [Streptomyces cadmiisoli]|uniref:Uncharacterized protein n=1 Tax=Streptomyces cadmiisoli TaxID=2184053 RepID=A0A2Z4IWN0_9ACTN|nr:hypothetical protein DN051_12945 [Streptomyces cadmiisoli]